MGIKLEKKTFTNPIGKPTKCRVVFKGTYRDVQVAIAFEAETEREIAGLIPLIPERTLELELRDPNATLSQFFTDDEALNQISADVEKMLKDEDAKGKKGKKGKGADS